MSSRRWRERRRWSERNINPTFFIVFLDIKAMQGMVELTCKEAEKWKKEQEASIDVDAFLKSIPIHPQYRPQSPQCLLELTRGVIKRQDGTEWVYYRCPMTRFDTKCYITCGED